MTTALAQSLQSKAPRAVNRVHTLRLGPNVKPDLQRAVQLKARFLAPALTTEMLLTMYLIYTLRKIFASPM